jgi:hypothetical protein
MLPRLAQHNRQTGCGLLRRFERFSSPRKDGKLRCRDLSIDESRSIFTLLVYTEYREVLFDFSQEISTGKRLFLFRASSVVMDLHNGLQN